MDPLSNEDGEQDSDRPVSLIDADPPADAPDMADDIAEEQPPPPAPSPPASTLPAPPPPTESTTEPLPDPEPPSEAPPPPSPSVESATPTRPAVASSISLSNTPLVDGIVGATSFDGLTKALENDWELPGDLGMGIERATTYVSGTDREVLGGFAVSQFNDIGMKQQRILVLSRSAYYRVTYSSKTQRIDHYHKTPLNKLRVVEKTVTGVKIYLTEQDGTVGLGKLAKSLFNRNKPKDEFEHVREYLPIVPTRGPSLEVVTDAIAAALHKAAELASAGGGGFAVPALMTTSDRKALLADRKEAERLEKERVEREAATEELKTAMTTATESRVFDGLVKPIKRAKKAVDVDASLITSADALHSELIEEKKERERQERLERERVEREAAVEELSNAMAAAKESRDAVLLVKPIKRAKKAVDFPAEPLAEAEALKGELDEEKKAADLKAIEDARLEKERIEREAATEELSKAVSSATATRDGAPPSPEEGGAAAMAAAAKALDKPIKRAKKAVDFPAEPLAEAEALKGELDEEEKARKEAEKLEKERIEREAATKEIEDATAATEESRETTALVKAIKRAKKAVGVESGLIEAAESLKNACDEEKRAAEQAAKDEKAAAKKEAAEAATAAKREAEEKKQAAKEEGGADEEPGREIILCSLLPPTSRAFREGRMAKWAPNLGAPVTDADCMVNRKGGGLERWTTGRRRRKMKSERSVGPFQNKLA
eukprot:CAMPEP_0115847016 /NCGR_PEP_ID=MMETSP0287-20121206/10160_1 /TAXON_ID=412157 /ORGANISM="Chrysochromulina rotalis, Strain UIO044" /LENGTH=720 /DNA_ID=CAMNT_0003300827 /DNA_START=26 /DNA_END=2186 /DNA_ORIENTATION=-